jgi:hypothetical protein
MIKLKQPDLEKYISIKSFPGNLVISMNPVNFNEELLNWFQENNIEYSTAWGVKYRKEIDSWEFNFNIFLEFFDKNHEMLFKLTWG